MQRVVPFPRERGLLECLNRYKHWYAAEIVSILPDDNIIVHFDGLKPRWNEKVPLSQVQRFRKFDSSRARFGGDEHYRINWSELSLLDLPHETSEPGEPIPESMTTKSPCMSPSRSPAFGLPVSPMMGPQQSWMLPMAESDLALLPFPTAHGLCECKDYTGNWYAAEIVQVVSPTVVVVHFDGWLPKWDEDVDIIVGAKRFRRFDPNRAQSGSNSKYLVDRTKPVLSLPYNPEEEAEVAAKKEENRTSPRTGRRRVDFHCTCKTGFGDTLCISGNLMQLGNWHPRRVELHYLRDVPGGCEWVLPIELELLPSTVVEYKYVWISSKGVTWEERPNRILAEGVTTVNDIFDA